MIDWRKTTTDELLGHIPEEDDKWEYKSATLFNDKGELKKELAIQVSAFANSYGGHLVLGLNKQRQWEPCPATVGRQTMKDYLAQLVEQSVEFAIRCFRIHQIPFTNDPSKFAYVIQIDDSPAAPHQAKNEAKGYYWRIDGHSKAAPHHYLELLRTRFTKSIISVEKISWDIPYIDLDHARLGIRLAIDMKNRSMQSATNWGIHIQHSQGFHSWQDSRGQDLAEGVCIHGGDTHVGIDFVASGSGMELMAYDKQRVPQTVLLPGEKRQIVLDLNGTPNSNQGYAYEKLFENFGLIILPVSHNHVGEQVLFGNPNSDWWNDCIHFRRTLKEHEEKFERQKR